MKESRLEKKLNKIAPRYSSVFYGWATDKHGEYRYGWHLQSYQNNNCRYLGKNYCEAYETLDINEQNIIKENANLEKTNNYLYSQLSTFFAEEFGNTYIFSYQGKKYDFSRYSEWMRTENLCDEETIENIMSWILEKLNDYEV